MANSLAEILANHPLVKRDSFGDPEDKEITWIIDGHLKRGKKVVFTPEGQIFVCENGDKPRFRGLNCSPQPNNKLL